MPIVSPLAHTSPVARTSALARTLSLTVPTVLLALAVSATRADDHVFSATDPTWKAECGACHVAYPPALLPAESWRKLMAGLDRHFGTDASLDAATTQAIAAFLERNAGRPRAGATAPPPLRVTQTPWFLHEHDELPARIWNSDAVQRGVNCEACHTRAADGDFGERTRSVPR